MSNKRKRIVALLFLAVTTISSIIFAPAVMAESDMTKIRHELLLNTIYGCYDSKHMSDFADIGLGATATPGDIDKIFIEEEIGDGGTYYDVTTSLDAAWDMKKLDCEVLAEKLFGELPNEEDPKGQQVYFTKLGYYENPHRVASKTYDPVGCLRVTYDALDGETYTAAHFCYRAGRGGDNAVADAYYTNLIKSFSAVVNDRESGSNPLFYGAPEVSLEVIGNGSVRALKLNLTGQASCGAETIITPFAGGTFDEGEEVTSYTCDDLEGVKVHVYGSAFASGNPVFESEHNYRSYYFFDQTAQKYETPRYGYSVMRSINESDVASGSTFYDFSDQEVYDLYVYYLKNIFGKTSLDPNKCSAEKPAVAFNADTDTGKILTSLGWCDVHYAYTTDASDQRAEVAIFGNPSNDNWGRHYYYLDTKVEFSGLIEQLYNHVSYLEEAGRLDDLTLLQLDANGSVPDSVVNLPPVEGELEEGTPDPCYDSALNLGWIVCPLINNTSRAMRELYQGIIKDYLTIDSVLLTTSDQGSSGTYQAWSVFVGFANVLTIIFLLVVIFSQVTGVGIDNYGIKKALPKIIIAAVLINLSFILCQLLADLSNIVGNSIENLLTNIGDGLTRQTTIQGSYASGEMFAHILDALLVAGGAAAIAGVVGAALSGGLPGLIIPLLIGLLVALAAILFFFVLLGLRKAAIVMLVAVSPIAFACYMLPNLKHQVFDKWFGLLKAMILIYPLCGFIIGGCNLASAILMSTGMEENFIFCFINMLLMVVPFFFLPTLIKKSMGALGNITSMASRAVRGGINRGGARARKWNEDRPANQQRRALRADRREQRWSNRVRARYNGGTDSPITQIPGIGSAIKRRRDAMYGAAIQSAMKSQDAEAMRQVLAEKGEEVLSGSATRAWLDAQRSVGEIGNYNDADFVSGTRFQNQQAIEDQLARNSRFADKTSQDAYRNRMAAQIHGEAVDDSVYSRPQFLAGAMQSNFENAVNTAQGFWSSALQNGQASYVDDNDVTHQVDINDRKSLEDGLKYALGKVDSAGTEADRIEYMAQARAYQTALLKNDEGYANVRAAYTSQNWGEHSMVRQMAAQLKNDNKNIKNKDRSLEAALQDVSEKGAATGEYAGAGISKITAETLSNYTQEYIESAVKRANTILRDGPSSDPDKAKDDNKFLQDFKVLRDNYLAANNTHKQARVVRALERFGTN